MYLEDLSSLVDQTLIENCSSNGFLPENTAIGRSCVKDTNKASYGGKVTILKSIESSYDAMVHNPAPKAA
jgi:hypothetical protein